MTTAMIVCSCNMIREADIRQAARAGARDPVGAYAKLGFEPECGGCLDLAAHIVDEERVKGPRLKLVSKVA